MALPSAVQAKCSVEMLPLGVDNIHSIECPTVDDPDLPRAIAEVGARARRPVDKLVLFLSRDLLFKIGMRFENIIILANTGEDQPH